MVEIGTIDCVFLYSCTPHPDLHDFIRSESNQEVIIQRIKAMATAGQDVEQVDEFSHTTMHVAAINNYADVIKVLAKYGVVVDREDDVNPMTPLHYAARYDNVEAMKMLIKVGANVNTVNRHMMTALHYAARYGQTEAIKVLVEMGADINKTDKHMRTPLYNAVIRGHLASVKMLIEYGAERGPTIEQCLPLLDQPIADDSVIQYLINPIKHT